MLKRAKHVLIKSYKQGTLDLSRVHNQIIYIIIGNSAYTW